jgi:cation diffusion facilitator family transporter
VRTIVVALFANLGVAIAKTATALITGSTAMSAEAAHAYADTGNQILLFVAQRRSTRPPDAHRPFGYGREAYFWALIASVGVFVAGALFSLREGIVELLDPTGASLFVAGYVVLAVSAVLDGLSLRQAVHQLRAEARSLERDFLDQVALTSDPTVRAVFGEDVAAVTGDVIAFLGLLLHQLTGSPVYDGVAAVLIGLLLAGVGLQLADRNRDFLTGEQAPPRARAEVERVVSTYPGVVAIRELLVTFLGPRRLWVLARVDVDDDLTGNEVEDLTRSIERRLREESPFIARADVVPVGVVPSHGDARDA